MSSVGYGDVLPQTDAEMLVTTLVMMIGACLFAFLLGSVTSLVSALNMQEQEYFMLRDQLNEFCASMELPPAICYKLRHFVRSRYEQGALFDWSTILNRLSPQLKEEVASFMYGADQQTNVYFRDSSAEELASIASTVIQRSFAKGESLIVPYEKPNSLFTICDGLVLFEGQIHGKGKLLGEDMLYFVVNKSQPTHINTNGMAQVQTPFERAMTKSSQQQKKMKSERLSSYSEKRDIRSRAVALSFTVANELTADRLESVFASHPELVQRVRRQVVLFTFRRHVMAYAKAHSRVFADSMCLLLRSSLDSELVRWYEAKLSILARYMADPVLKKIIKVQKYMRGFLCKIRFKKAITVLLTDPLYMHRQLTDQIKRLDQNRTSAPDMMQLMQNQLQKAMEAAAYAEEKHKCSSDPTMQEMWKDAQRQQAEVVKSLSTRINDTCHEAVVCGNSEIYGAVTRAELQFLEEK